MEELLHQFNKHPIAIILLLLYTSLCVRFLVLVHILHEFLNTHPNASGLALGDEGLGYTSALLVFFGGLFFLVSGCYAIGSKTETRFWLCIGFIVIAEMIITLNIG